MNDPEDDDRLPASVGGLLGFAIASYLERAPLYLALAALAFAIDAIAQLLAPDKIPVGIAAGIVGDALVIAAVSLGVGTRAAGKTAEPARLFEAAVVRWGDVAGAYGIATLISAVVYPVALFRTGTDPWSLASALPAWVLLGALSFAGPVTALSSDRPILAILTGFGRAMALSLRLANLPRLLIVSATVMAVAGLQIAVEAALARAHAQHASAWTDDLIDALTAGPLTALQAAFALDFARRIRRLMTPPKA